MKKTVFLAIVSCALAANADNWHGFERETFEFDGRQAWIVKPSAEPAEGRPWTWTIQWADAFVDRTGVLDLLRRGFHHATIDLFDTRMTDGGVEIAAAFQKFLVGKYDLDPKANLVGMSWGGFFSTRYAAAHPENVRKIYYDAPLMNFDGFDESAIGPWAGLKPGSGSWSEDPRMPVNLAGKIAAAGIPVMLLYGGQDLVVPPARNCEIFLPRFREAGGQVGYVENRPLFGHHPHGLDPDKTGPIVDFFLGR